MLFFAFLAGNVRDLRSGVYPVKEEKEEVYKKALPPPLSIIIDRPHTHKRGGGWGRRRERKLFFFLVFIFIEGEKSQSPIIWRHIFHRRGVVAGRNAIDYRNYLKKKRPEKYRKLNWSWFNSRFVLRMGVRRRRGVEEESWVCSIDREETPPPPSPPPDATAAQEKDELSLLIAFALSAGASHTHTHRQLFIIHSLVRVCVCFLLFPPCLSSSLPIYREFFPVSIFFFSLLSLACVYIETEEFSSLPPCLFYTGKI